MLRPWRTFPVEYSLGESPAFPSVLFMTRSTCLLIFAFLPVWPLGGEPLSLREALDRALHNNLGLSVERFALAIAEQRVVEAEGVFTPVISLSATHAENLNPPSNNILDDIGDGSLLTGSEALQIETVNRRYAVAATKPFSTGTEISVEAGLNRTTSNSPNLRSGQESNADFGVSVRQPLMQGAWQAVNLAPLAQARANRSGAEFGLRQDILDLLRATENAYWELSAARQRRELRQTSVDLAERLLEETLERERLGLATRVDILQARSSLASQQETLIIAEQSIADAEDVLRVQIGTMADEFMTSDALEVAALPMIPEEERAFTEVWAQTRGASLDLRVQETVIEAQEVDVRQQRNAVQPRLDFTISGGYRGRAPEVRGSLSSLERGDGYVWSTGLELSIPWGFQEERARRQQAELRLRQEERRIDAISSNLLRETRQAYRALQTSRQRLEAAEAALALQEESFEQERARYTHGLVTFRDVLEAQNDLDEARLSRLEAELARVQASVALARLDGTLLPRHGYSWEAIPVTPGRPVVLPSPEL